MKIKIGVNGVCGRMGRRLVALTAADPELELTLALDAENSPEQGRDAGELAGVDRLGVAIGSTISLADHIDVLIDFSQPEGTMAVLPTCITRQIPLLVATTGHTPAQRREI